MRYLGIDAHSTASVWCLLDEDGRTLSTGRCETAFDRQLFTGGFAHRVST